MPFQLKSQFIDEVIKGYPNWVTEQVLKYSTIIGLDLIIQQNKKRSVIDQTALQKTVDLIKQKLRTQLKTSQKVQVDPNTNAALKIKNQNQSLILDEISKLKHEIQFLNEQYQNQQVQGQIQTIEQVDSESSRSPNSRINRSLEESLPQAIIQRSRSVPCSTQNNARSKGDNKFKILTINNQNLKINLQKSGEMVMSRFSTLREINEGFQFVKAKFQGKNIQGLFQIFIESTEQTHIEDIIYPNWWKQLGKREVQQYSLTPQVTQVDPKVYNSPPTEVHISKHYLDDNEMQNNKKTLLQSQFNNTKSKKVLFEKFEKDGNKNSKSILGGRPVNISQVEAQPPRPISFTVNMKTSNQDQQQQENFNSLAQQYQQTAIHNNASVSKPSPSNQNRNSDVYSDRKPFVLQANVISPQFQGPYSSNDESKNFNSGPEFANSADETRQINIQDQQSNNYHRALRETSNSHGGASNNYSQNISYGQNSHTINQNSSLSNFSLGPKPDNAIFQQQKNNTGSSNHSKLAVDSNSYNNSHNSTSNHPNPSSKQQRLTSNLKARMAYNAKQRADSQRQKDQKQVIPTYLQNVESKIRDEVDRHQRQNSDYRKLKQKLSQDEQIKNLEIQYRQKFGDDFPEEHSFSPQKFERSMKSNNTTLEYRNDLSNQQRSGEFYNQQQQQQINQSSKFNSNYQSSNQHQFDDSRVSDSRYDDGDVDPLRREGEGKRTISERHRRDGYQEDNKNISDDDFVTFNANSHENDDSFIRNKNNNIRQSNNRSQPHQSSSGTSFIQNQNPTQNEEQSERIFEGVSKEYITRQGFRDIDNAQQAQEIGKYPSGNSNEYQNQVPNQNQMHKNQHPNPQHSINGLPNTGPHYPPLPPNNPRLQGTQQQNSSKKLRFGINNQEGHVDDYNHHSNNTTNFNINNASMSDQSMYGALFTLNNREKGMNFNRQEEFKSGKNTRRTYLSGAPEMSFINSPELKDASNPSSYIKTSDLLQKLQPRESVKNVGVQVFESNEGYQAPGLRQHSQTIDFLEQSDIMGRAGVRAGETNFNKFRESQLPSRIIDDQLKSKDDFRLKKSLDRKTDDGSSSLSSSFSMFNPNQELQVFFQNDFLERSRRDGEQDQVGGIPSAGRDQRKDYLRFSHQKNLDYVSSSDRLDIAKYDNQDRGTNFNRNQSTNEDIYPNFIRSSNSSLQNSKNFIYQH